MAFLSIFTFVVAMAFVIIQPRVFALDRLDRHLPLHRDSAADAADGGEGALASEDDEAVLKTGLLTAKRGVDILLSLAVLIFLSPLLLLTALAIRLDSPGPAIYRQTRIGLGGKPFTLWKFRSMREDAEKNGPQYAAVNDTRVTRLGRILRKYRIDEFPQAVNVLRGDMSFIGPRPERPEFVAELERKIPDYHARHMIKPGITGWAQVKYEYAASVEGARKKLVYDLYYIRNFSIILDIVILFMTVRVALFGLGSR